MTNKNRCSLLNARAKIPALGINAGLRVYSLGTGPDTEFFFSMRLWLAMSQRQERMARCASCAAR